MNALVSNVLTQVFITLIAVSGIYVLTGLTGMFSLGQAAFMAIGSYVSGLLVIRAHVPFALAALLAVAGATLIGYVIGYPVVRLRRDYISLVTLGFGEAIAALLNRMTTLTGGASAMCYTSEDVMAASPVWSGCRWRLFPPCLPLRWQRFSRPANTAASASR